jgi:hypothetical protein
MEKLCLRIKDVDFEKNSIVVRDGKAMRAAVQAEGIHKPAKCHTLRHSWPPSYWSEAAIFVRSRSCLVIAI